MQKQPADERRSPLQHVWESLWVSAVVIATGLWVMIVLGLAVDLATGRIAIPLGKLRQQTPRLLRQAIRPKFAAVPVTAVTWGLVLGLWQPPAISLETPHVLYLFSTSAQSLAAISALIVTISLVMAQLISGYSVRVLPLVFGPWVIPYIFLFFGAIATPLVLLGYEEPGKWFVKVSLALGITALIWVVPYARDFLDRIRPDRMIEELKARGGRLVDVPAVGVPQGLGDVVDTLDEITMRALALRDYGSGRLAAMVLVDLVVASDNGELYNEIRRRFGVMRLAVQDERAESILAEVIARMGI